MDKEFVPYEQALELKELGFDEPCLGRWIEPIELSISAPADDEYCQKQDEFTWTALAPLYQQAFRWFREKYQLHSYIEGAYPWFRFYINSEDNRWEGHKHLLHEEAELACLKKLIQIVKENKQ